ncbi:1-acyl-sn-glycerol-3-phosphate acyltransferase [Myxacorys almedinensis]|uniref:Glycerol acyltransferase n=1 Tax=Myxacorys almedinensis A TaxID=2690445 RepID=A0A8J7ZAF4_9CYAN|nr:1-acyl-sn-glycerol-3-phosphate acyltransferase [Myxacorys almedinensis]NDJ18375.1 glycerol acyltransferase [Myxacorys almedinensis A]
MTPFRFSWFDRFCLWYPPAWLILFNRHWQHYRPDPGGWNWLEYALFLMPGGFYLALLMRWTRLGFRLPIATDIKPDPEYQKAFRDEILAPIVLRYFRAEIHHLEYLPDSPPVVVALNHAGMCFPWDFVCLGFLLGQETGWFVQPVAHSLFFDHLWLRWWLPQGWAQAMGGVRAERQSVERAISAGSNSAGIAASHTTDETAQKQVLLYAPESWRGLAKGWRRRYQLETFDPSFIRLSIRYSVPVLPIVCLGNENLHPWTFNSKWLAQRFKMPLLPVSPFLLVFVLFPSLGVWAMRSHLRYYLQPLQSPWKDVEPIRLQTYQYAEKLRSQMQTELLDLQHK